MGKRDCFSKKLIHWLNRSTIYCWQLIRLNSSGGQGQHLYPAVFREQFVRSEPLQGLPASSAQIAGEGVMGVYYLCSPLKTNPTKEQSFAFCWQLWAALTYGAPGSFCWGVGVQVAWRYGLQPSAECQLHFELNSNGETGSRKEGRGEEKGSRGEMRPFCDGGKCAHPNCHSLHTCSKSTLRRSTSWVVWEKKKVEGRGVKRSGKGEQEMGKSRYTSEVICSFLTTV